MVWRVIQSMGLVVVLIAAIGALGTKLGFGFTPLASKCFSLHSFLFSRSRGVAYRDRCELETQDARTLDRLGD